jgi:BirA family biotin operon repressor/biotin-[acetyl-CoA-carboxylase] ligase
MINFKEVDSTNDRAHTFARQGFRDGTVITADRQTKGRGRRGSRWCSPDGGLYCSIILRPKVSPEATGIFEKISGIAVWETATALIPRRPFLKLPNDILVEGRKVAGILIEARGRRDYVDHLVIGIGINCAEGLDPFPEDLRSRITTLSEEAGRPVTPAETLRILLACMNRWYMPLVSGGGEEIARRWEALVGEGACQVCS